MGHMKNERRVHPSSLSRKIRNVGDPDIIGARRCELTFDEISGYYSALALGAVGMFPHPTDSVDVQLTHQPLPVARVVRFIDFLDADHQSVVPSNFTASPSFLDAEHEHTVIRAAVPERARTIGLTPNSSRLSLIRVPIPSQAGEAPPLLTEARERFLVHAVEGDHRLRRNLGLDVRVETGAGAEALSNSLV